MPRKTFVAGEILTAADVNTNLMDQAVMVFADSAARGSAIPSPSEGMVTYLSDVNLVEAYTGAAFVPVNTGFTASTTITATNASFSVPSLGAPIVRVTVIGGGGGGGGATGNGGTGGTTTFNAGGAGTVTAVGGNGGTQGSGFTNVAGIAGIGGLTSGNAGTGANEFAGSPTRSFSSTNGTGGAITISYLNLAGIGTVNVTIGAGGTGGTGVVAGGAGGRGEVIVEYVAA
jgi:hypothetical protein